MNSLTYQSDIRFTYSQVGSMDAEHKSVNGEGEDNPAGKIRDEKKMQHNK